MAQTLPDAGVLRQQLDNVRQPSLPAEARLPELKVQQNPTAPANTVFDVKRIRFTGNTLFQHEQLEKIVAAYQGRQLTLTELQQAAADVTTAYRDAGWIARAFIPRQDVTDGHVTIQIIEATFGGVVQEGPDPLRLKMSLVLNIIAAQQSSGARLNADALDRAVLLADDLPGIAVAGSLQTGAGPGETRLVLKLSDEPLLVGNVALDNTGSRSTGSERISINANLNSPMGWGDLLTSNVVHSEGNDYVRLDYTVPVGAQGWRVGVNASNMVYRVTAPEFSALRSTGKSESAGLSASYPFIRSRKSNLYLQLNADQKLNHNESNAAIQSDYVVDSNSVGLSGNVFDSLGGGGSSSFSLSYVGGSIRGTGSDPVPASHAVGSFDKLRYFLSRQQAITDKLSVYAAVSGQVTQQNLDSSEKFYLGGSNGVRAYPVSEGTGSSGQLANLELRWRMAPTLVLTLFRDLGQVSNNDKNANYSLSGNGLSVIWQTPPGPTLHATWAHRTGDNPNPTASGNDQDGSRSEDRVWVSLGIPF